VRAYAEERAVEAADGEELPHIAAGDGPAGEARAAGDGEARGGELDEGLDLGGLLGRALAEEAHGCLCLLSFGSGARRRLGGGGLVMLRVVGWRRSSYTSPWTGARRLRNRTCLWTTEPALQEREGQPFAVCCGAQECLPLLHWVASKFDAGSCIFKVRKPPRRFIMPNELCIFRSLVCQDALKIHCWQKGKIRQEIAVFPLRGVRWL
jgi:hypothetical protein